MTLQVKKGGAYAAPVSVSVKKNGVYTAIVGVFAKVAGAYQSVLGAPAPSFVWAPVKFGSYLSATMPAGLDSATSSVAFYYVSNSTIAATRTLADFGRCTIAINSTGKMYVTLADSSTAKTLIFTTVDLAADGHYAIEWDTTADSSVVADSKTCHIYYNGASIPITKEDNSVGFVVQHQFGATIGANAAAANPSYADIGEFMFWPKVFADWATNISNVFSAGNLVDPGANGIDALGVIPNVYLSVRGSELGTAFATNRGSGPAFTLNGTVLQIANEALLLYGDSMVEGTGASAAGTRWGSMLPSQLNRPIKAMNYGNGGQGITWIANAMVSGDVPEAVPSAATAAARYRAETWILEGGYNTIANGAVTIIAQAQRMIDAVMATDPNAKYIFIGIPNGQNADEGIGGVRYQTIIDSNVGIAALAGTHFLDMRQWLVDNGLAAAGLTATANDLTDISQGRVPRQLQADGLHYNDYGHVAWTVAIKAKLQALGYD